MALVGHAGAGKSTLLRLLAEGSTWLRNEELRQVSCLPSAYVIHPISVLAVLTYLSCLHPGEFDQTIVTVVRRERIDDLSSGDVLGNWLRRLAKPTTQRSNDAKHKGGILSLCLTMPAGSHQLEVTRM